MVNVPPERLPPSAQVLASVHTSNLPDLLDQLQLSFVVSTYQAGKVVLARNNGGVLNTHFCSFGKPMGIAADPAQLTIGGANTVWYYRNVPAVAATLDPAGKYDACYLPRRLHVTGDIDIHELAYDEKSELWVVNTRFGCLCTLDVDHSFHPRWRPPFLSALAPEDRCHLNGLAMMEGRPKYATALGETDTEGGWRANKARGGILIDIEEDVVLLRGLSMPHSPRWYQGRLWVLESGEGSLVLIDLKKCRWRTVAQLPGFTRGLDFLGPLAFIGLSQVRESAVFSGIPLVARLKERTCGVWVVNIETGQTVGFLRFESGVQEIFAVQVLPGLRFPQLLEWDDERLAHSYVLPDAALSQVKLPSDEELARSPAFHFQRATTFYHEGKLEKAVAAYRQCVALDPTFPNARYNLGIALGDLEEYAEATATMEALIEAEPERAEAYNSLGYLVSRQGQAQQALAHYERAIEQQPEYPEAHFNLSLTLLQLQDYQRGFAEYEWRWKTGQFTPFACPHPLWDGQPLPGQTLLIYTEQCASDALQFARYLPLAAERCAKLLVVCMEDLLPLFATIPGIAELRQPGQLEVREFDVHLPLLSLPRIFETTRESIPAPIPYFDLAAIRRRKGEVAPSLPASSRLKLGLTWAGSPSYKHDGQRSCPLSALLPVLAIAGVDLYGLQKGERRQELKRLPPGCKMQDLGDLLHDFGDTAVLIDQLDLVITVDTAVAHLAGALGKPVWTLLPHVADWRWGLDGETTPWYPSMRLFRQAYRGDWAEVIARLALALASIATTHD
ncbi:MAG: TIGR03032 family protein [Gammaproteobacteria bacterium]